MTARPTPLDPGRAEETPAAADRGRRQGRARPAPGRRRQPRHARRGVARRHGGDARRARQAHDRHRRIDGAAHRLRHARSPGRSACAETRDGGFARSAIRTIAERAQEFDAVVAGPGMQQSKLCADAGRRAARAGPRPARARRRHAPRACPPHDRRVAAQQPTPILLAPHRRNGGAARLRSGGSRGRSARAAAARCAARYGALTLVKGAAEPRRHPRRPRRGSTGAAVPASASPESATRSPASSAACSRAAPSRSPPCCGRVWLHGEAGAALSKKVGQVGFLAREIPGEIPALCPARLPPDRCSCPARRRSAGRHG